MNQSTADKLTTKQVNEKRKWFFFKTETTNSMTIYEEQVSSSVATRPTDHQVDQQLNRGANAAATTTTTTTHGNGGGSSTRPATTTWLRHKYTTLTRVLDSLCCCCCRRRQRRDSTADKTQTRRRRRKKTSDEEDPLQQNSNQSTTTNQTQQNSNPLQNIATVDTSQSDYLLLPSNSTTICMVIDLDETLVHSSFKPIPNADFIIPVEIDGQIHSVYVAKRPYVDEFLRRMGELYECILFTASLAKYADPVADLLDKWNVFRARLFRESCVFHRGNYVKDLTRLGRDLERVVIIDNSPASYIFHPDNAVPVTSWFDDTNDTELLYLIPFFERLANVDNIYTVLRNSNHPFNNLSCGGQVQQQQQMQLGGQQQIQLVGAGESMQQSGRNNFYEGDVKLVDNSIISNLEKVVVSS